MQDYSFNSPLSTWHPKVRRLYEYWIKLHPPSDALPGHQHFSADDIADVLPLVWILDVYRDPLRFQYRFLGPLHARAMQRDLTGCRMDEVHPAFLKSYIYQHYVDLAKQARPSYRKGRARFGVDPELYEMERLLLPMAQNGQDIDMVLAITVYYDITGSEAFR
jgi:hypothetical protein